MRSARRPHGLLKNLLKLAAPVAMALGLLVAATGSASAVIVDSQASCDSGNKIAFMLVKTDSAHPLTCYESGENKNVGNAPANDDFLKAFPGYIALNNTKNNENAILSDAQVWKTKIDQNGDNYNASNHQTFELVASLLQSYHSIVIALKQGNGFAAFFLPDGVLKGEWWTADGGLSHAVVYGLAGPAVVPLPAGIALGAGALGLLGALGWRKRKQAAA